MKKYLNLIRTLYREADVYCLSNVVAIALVVIAISPLDLIPDCVPVLGYFEGVLVVPIGLVIAWSFARHKFFKRGSF